ncbi:MAG TPA: penicillin-binding protein 2 [Sulfurovum sp.]|jgi:penicillin-binding protein 2|nr:MAG: penicillin-binding protein 2 [Sulfurovum sp. 35-42-20]OYZ25383.1 MAG: penicillin-binding protein 2 [Sulfurovum sp. 16-42-52]OYZ49851.1 MAG: penicillin-binding protein 2 [Sulfurovum sp. 24-42-9]OZA45479.1 MAG: penicillin-binding protein 2 [Sulfurovum sp. 17-42-90]OZA59410.1 MAG: penicillin-binding protein 2 [Sulfurovum sp. 39-42-12]HQR74057.1 penicillin-binding protein 2 [Sulfurovum sp.]
MRYKIVIVIFFIFWAVMVSRLYHVSIKSNFYYEELAKENVERKQFLKPVRGEITDNHGNLLAMNQIGFSLSIAPHLKEKSVRLDKIINTLIDTFPDLNKTVMLKVYKKNNSPYNHQFIKVVDFIHYSDMMGAYPELSLVEGIKIEAETKRYYPYGRYAAHIVGYTGKSNQKENDSDTVVNEVGKIGKSGLENQYNKVLEGELGYEVTKVTATNKAIEVLENVPAKDNKNLVLNIDIDLQQMIYERFGEATGVAIVMKTNGEVLAAVSYPSYDPNMFVGGISAKDWKALLEDLNHPFTNKFIHGTYPPGSTIKMGMALAYEKALPGTLGTSEHCSGHITLGSSKHKFRCWSKYGHGTTALRKAIRESCDVYFYNKSLKVGIDDMAKNLRTFGLGVKTGVDLPLEHEGVMPDKAWKRKRFNQPWYLGETVIASIGQGYDLVTPLQLARYTGLMATSYLATPHIAKEVDGKTVKPELKHIDFDAFNINEIRKGMYDVCNVPGGTGYATMRNLPVIVAGKTGTSQVTAIPQSTQKRLKEEQLAYFHRSHAWITTYAPYENPQYIVTVLVEHGGHGGSTSGPIAADIYKWLYEKGYFAKEKEATQKSGTVTNKK